MDPTYEDLTLAEAEAELERVKAAQPIWCGWFMGLFADNTGTTLDQTLASLAPAWDFVLEFEGSTGLSEPDPSITLDPSLRTLSPEKAWLISLFSGYWTTVVGQVTEARWSLASDGSVLKNSPLFDTGVAYRGRSRGSWLGIVYRQQRTGQYLLELTLDELEEARSPTTLKSPLYEVKRFYDDVNLTYCEEILHNDKHHPFLDQVHEQFIKRFGPGMYLENYKDSFIIEEPANIDETIRIVTEIAEQAGDPR